MKKFIFTALIIMLFTLFFTSVIADQEVKQEFLQPKYSDARVDVIYGVVDPRIRVGERKEIRI